MWVWKLSHTLNAEPKSRRECQVEAINRPQLRCPAERGRLGRRRLARGTTRYPCCHFIEMVGILVPRRDTEIPPPVNGAPV